jgi:hypothetical protein
MYVSNFLQKMKELGSVVRENFPFKEVYSLIPDGFTPLSYWIYNDL